MLELVAGIKVTRGLEFRRGRSVRFTEAMDMEGREAAEGVLLEFGMRWSFGTCFPGLPCVLRDCLNPVCF